MSRFIIEHQTLDIIVGWDPPLATYFVQVRTRPDDPNQAPQDLVWRGCVIGDLRSSDAVAQLVAPYATLPHHLLDELRISMENDAT